MIAFDDSKWTPKVSYEASCGVFEISMFFTDVNDFACENLKIASLVVIVEFSLVST